MTSHKINEHLAELEKGLARRFADGAHPNVPRIWSGQPLRVIIPYERARKVAVLTPRSEAEIKALTAQAHR